MPAMQTDTYQWNRKSPDNISMDNEQIFNKEAKNNLK